MPCVLSSRAGRGVGVIALLQELKSLHLAPGDYAVFGSGPLIVRGIVAATNDLDVICRGRAWEQVKAIGESRYDQQYDVDMVELFDGQLTFGTKWGIALEGRLLLWLKDRIDRSFMAKYG